MEAWSEGGTEAVHALVGATLEGERLSTSDGRPCRGVCGLRAVQARQQKVVRNIHGMAEALFVGWRWLSDEGSIEAKAVGDHHVDVPLAVLLPHALVGGEAGQRGLQGGQAVAGGQAHQEQLAVLLCVAAQFVL